MTAERRTPLEGRTEGRDIDAVELARALIRLRTVNPPGDERACIDHLARILDRAGFSVGVYEFAPGRGSLVARREGTARTSPLCFAGHIDTVPLGTAPWRVDPFEGRVEGDRLHGRGASDMKGGVAAFVAAALRMAASASSPPLLLVVAAGEETGCEGSFHLAGLPGALGDAGALVVAEPTANYPLVGHKGALWLRITTRGVSAHGSMPELGVNAIYAAARAVGRLERLGFGDTAHPVLGTPTLNVGTISGGASINSVPDRATIGVDIRTVPGLDHDGVVERIRRELGGDVEITRVVDVPPVWTDPDHPWIQAVFRIMTPFLGEAPVPRSAPYFTDAAALAPALGGAPTVILGPGDPGQAHRTDEFCSVSKIRQAVEAYVRIGRRWCER